MRTTSAVRFTIVTDAGERITVTHGKARVIAPSRRERGPWGQLKQHPTLPRADKELHPDGEVKIDGGWLLAGERVAVLGYASYDRFVAGTGGPRDAPEQRVSS